jgi:hypothetical protein
MQRDFNDQPLPDDTNESIKASLYEGRKIDAIKLFRQISGEGLKESKDFVEDLDEELRVSDPARYISGPRGKGCGISVLVISVIIGVATNILL